MSQNKESKANLSYVSFTSANLWRANFDRAFLKNADMRYVRNLEYALSLEHATLDGTKAALDEIRIIQLAKRKIQLFNI